MTPARLPHAVMDVPSRSHKGLKIKQMLDLSDAKGSYDLLEIGCGNGGISGYFARSEQPTFHVTAVDVIDNRVVTDGFVFIPMPHSISC